MADRKHKVLIVDDEPTLLKMLGKSLANEVKCELILTSSPRDAVSILQDEEVSVLLCDLIMPVISGVDVIKAAYEKDANIVSIMLTGKASTQPILQALNQGGLWRCMEKPCRPQEIIDTVKAGIDEYDMRFHGRMAKAAQRAQKDLLEAHTDQRKVVKKVVRKPKAPLAAIPPGGKRRIQIRAQKKIVLKPKGYTDEKTKKFRRELNPLNMVEKRYKIKRLIKEGGFSSVYQAEDTLLNMPVAIKILLPGFSDNKGSVKSLFDEARITMKLSHNNIVKLHTMQESHGIYYLVMEYIDGQTLRELLDANGPVDYENIIQLAEIVGDALEYAHNMNILHHDLKPDNIMLDRSGTVKVIDMGLACLADANIAGDEICGTPYYMSPEEIRGDGLDQRSDVYSMAVVLHEMLTGKKPVVADTEGDFLNLSPDIEKSLPYEVRHVFEIGLAENPENRWSSVKDMARALREAAPSMEAVAAV